ncbi:uncharacterized protein C2845_PM16G14070 [Panicum miliaceum]|uniref:Uncharacterized protein n=1 Tax=Panicum miliaceum TaxID=4540 RepID=A0A3L6PYC7_PANMI|nr:uncharacterized protein C2845_PM16G14070 [Panicum miliaceum]
MTRSCDSRRCALGRGQRETGKAVLTALDLCPCELLVLGVVSGEDAATVFGGTLVRLELEVILHCGCAVPIVGLIAGSGGFGFSDIIGEASESEISWNKFALVFRSDTNGEPVAVGFRRAQAARLLDGSTHVPVPGALSASAVPTSAASSAPPPAAAASQSPRRLFGETLLCVAGGLLGFIIVCGFTLFFKGFHRLHVLGFVSVALTVASNFCRMKSSGTPQLSKLGFSVAIAGFIGGLLWITKGFAADYFSDDTHKHGFLSVLFKKFFFWKLSSAAGSLFRGRDLVILMILRAGESRNLHVNRAELVTVPTESSQRVKEFTAEDGADLVAVSTSSDWIN